MIDITFSQELPFQAVFSVLELLSSVPVSSHIHWSIGTVYLPLKEV